MQPEIHLGPVTLQTFGIMFALGFIAAGPVLGRRLKELGKPTDWAYEVVIAALVGGIIGARLNFVIENYDAVKGDLLGNLFSGSGLVWFGGAIGGAIGVTLWAWRRKMLNLTLLDICAVPLSVGYAIGRIGCQVSGDGDYGKAWDGPWAMAYPNGTKPIDTPVHPTPIYETLAMGLVAYFLWRLRDRVQPGILFAIYLVLVGTERLLVEFIRRNSPELLGLTEAQLISVVMIAAGTVWLAVKARRGPLIRRGAGPGPRASEAPA
jgi:phosphatidylglycerol---prolipoprotein diacylglyceryl transferase